MNATTDTYTVGEMSITATKALGLYGYQANEWHVVVIRDVTHADGRTTHSTDVWCNSRAKAHSIKEDVAPTVENVTCDKCLKALKRAAK